MSYLLVGLATVVTVAAGFLVARRRRRSPSVAERSAAFAWYETTFACSRDAILVSDAEGRIVMSNPAAHELTGFAPDELRARTIWGLHDPASRPRIRRQYQDALAKGSDEYRATVLTKRAGPVQVEFDLLRVTVGKENFLHVTVRDVSARVLIERALRSSEDKFAKIFRVSPDPIAIVGLRSGRVVNVNEAFERALGLQREDLLGRTVIDLGLWVDARARTAFVAQVERDGRIKGYEAAIRASGDIVRHFLISAERVELGGENYVLTVSTDITDRRAAELAVREQKDFVEELIRSSSDGILAYDREFRYTVWNPAMERISGMTQAQVVGRVAFEVFPFLKEIGLDVAFSDALEGKTVTTGDLPYEVPETGKRGFFDAHYSPLRGPSGDIVGGLGIVRETTARKSVEDSLASAYQQVQAAQQRLERETTLVRLLQEVAVAANEVVTPGAALRAAAELICHITAWEIGHAYLPSADGTVLVPTEIWLETDDADISAFRVATARTDFPLGEGLPGRVFATRQPEVIEDVRTRADFYRAQAAQDAGIAGALAIPVISGERAVAVLEFFRRGPAEGDQALLQVARHIGTVLGRVFEREAAQYAVVQARDRFASFFHANPVASAITTLPEGRVREVNNRMLDLVEYGREELVGRTTTELGLWADSTQRTEVMQRLDRDGYIQNVEVTLRTKSGAVRHVVETLQRIELDGEPCVLASAVDVTERRRVEDALREVAEGISAETGERFFRSLVQRLASAVGSEYAFIGEVVEGERVRTIAAAADGQLVDNFVYDLVDTPCANVVRQSLCCYPRDVQQLFPRDVLLRDMGVESYAGMPLQASSGDVIGLLVVMGRRELHQLGIAEALLQIYAVRAAAELERLEAERSLRDSEERYRGLFDGMPVGVYRSTPDGRILDANQALVRMLGYVDREALLRVRADQIWLYPEERVRWRGVLEREGAVRGFEFQGRRADGSILWVRTNSRAVRSADNQVLYFEGMFEDITERKHTEQMLRTSRSEQQALARRVLDVQEEERARIARELHDQIGQALTAVKLNIEAALAVPASHGVGPADESIKLVDHAIQQVRTMSFELRPSMLDDLGLAAAIKAYAKRQADKAGLALRLNVAQPASVPRKEVETACFRIVQEAVTNIVRHSRAKEIEVQLHEAHGILHLSVRDDGVGYRHTWNGGRQRDQHLGVLGMMERAEFAGGRLAIETPPDGGTLVRAEFQLASSERALATRDEGA